MLIWKKQWIQDYESTWSIIEKFKLANQVTGKDFFQYVIDNKKATFIQKSVRNKSISYMKSIAKDKLSMILKIDIENYEDKIENLLASPLANLILFNYNICFCRKCISSGYHSIFHQYTFISNCPFHPEEKLIDKCPNCNKYFREYNLGYNEVGFCCESCKVSIVNDENFNYILNKWANRKVINDPFIKSLMNDDYSIQFNARYIFSTVDLDFAAVNNSIYTALSEQFLEFKNNKKPLAITFSKESSFSPKYKKNRESKLKIGYFHRELYKNFCEKNNTLNGKNSLMVSNLYSSIQDIEFFNKLLDYELFKRSKAILKSVDRYIQKKIKTEMNLKKDSSDSSEINPYEKAYIDWRASCYGIAKSSDKLYTPLGVDTPVFKFRFPFTFDEIETYPALANHQIINEVISEFKNETYSFSFISNVFSKLLFNFLYIHFQKELCYSLNLKNIRNQNHVLPPFIQLVKKDNENKIQQVAFLNFFELYDIDLNLIRNPQIKWSSDEFKR